MISSRLILLGFLCIIFVIGVQSSCSMTSATSKVTKFGNNDIQCSYKDIKMLPGSTLKLAFPDCVQCTCSKDGLSCCGFGFAAGVQQGPPGCVAHNDACNLVFVKANNSSELCKSSKTPSKAKKPKKTL